MCAHTRRYAASGVSAEALAGQDPTGAWLGPLDMRMTKDGPLQSVYLLYMSIAITDTIADGVSDGKADRYTILVAVGAGKPMPPPQVQNVLALFNPQQFMQAPLSHKAMKFVEAARYGGSRRSVAKCEQRYTCSLGMDILQNLF